MRLLKLLLFLIPGIALSREGNRHLQYPPSTILSSSPRRSTFFDQALNYDGDDDLSSDFKVVPRFFSRNQDAIPPELPEDYKDGGAADTEDRLPHSPVIFRYYSKKRSRTRASGSIPFILLGPNVEHWRTAGEHLAARGFSVIACERDPAESDDEEDDESKKQQSTTSSPWIQEQWWKGGDEEAAYLVSNVLQASRWSKAILVACDSEAVLAIQAACRLAPEKIAGLVLCGDLNEVHSLLELSHPELVQAGRNFAIDAFLSEVLPCPFAIAWDGETSSAHRQATPSEYDASSPAECLHGNRCFILGGGVAPHRRQPETFAWTLTRFVEDKVAPSIPIEEKKKLFRRVRKERKSSDGVSNSPSLPKGLKRLFSHTVFSGDFFSSGSLVVYGRIMAFALLYGSMLKVAIFQYGNFLDGAVNLKTRYDVLRTLKGRILGMISGFFKNFGYIPLLFRGKESDPEPEPDPMDFVTPLQNDSGNFEHGEDVISEQEDNLDEAEAANDEEKETLEESSDEMQQSAESDAERTDAEDDEDGEIETEETTVDEATPEEKEENEERPVFQPLFFLDRVVALESTPGDLQRRT